MKHINGCYEMLSEGINKSPKMDLSDKEMGRIIPVDLCQYSNFHKDYGVHQVFLVDDPRFRNKIVLVPGMLTFRKVSEGEKILLGKDWHNTPESLSGSATNWRLMDIDEMEAFYDFYQSGGMGEYDEMVDETGALDYGTSDLEDIDHPNRSRIYSINFRNGKRRSNYQHEEKLIIGIRDVSDDDIVAMLKDILDQTSFPEFTIVAHRTIKAYPHLEDRLKSFFGESPEEAFKGSRMLRRFGEY
jgi:hypothetical protein